MKRDKLWGSVSDLNYIALNFGVIKMIVEALVEMVSKGN